MNFGNGDAWGRDSFKQRSRSISHRNEDWFFTRISVSFPVAMSIRSRIWYTQLLAVVLPVGVCLYLMGRVAYDHAIKQAEELHGERAQSASKGLDAFLRVRIGHAVNLLVISPQIQMLVAREQPQEVKGDMERQRAEVRDHWQEQTDPNDQRMSWFYRGLPAQRFQMVQKLFPELKDFLLVDHEGLPIAGTEKPQAYDQSQKEWFTRMRGNTNADVMTGKWEPEGEHPGPRRLEILIKLPDVTSRSSPAVNEGGYLKLSYEFASVFNEYSKEMIGYPFEGIITDNGGKVVWTSGAFIHFPLEETLPSEWLPRNGVDKHSTIPLQVSSGKKPERRYLVSRSSLKNGERSSEFEIFVYSGSTKESVVGPLRRKQWMIFGGTFLVIGLAAIASSIYMRRTISRPIEQIAHVTNELTAHSQYGQILEEEEVEQLVAPLREVKTHDELNALAEGFSQMSVKALGFQRVLEHEVEEKTRVIQDDLEMAREFQQALLPRVCPECGSTQRADPLTLELAHFYQPAAYVSGDFYDYIPVDEHRVAVLIGDVMGHGARAALVTAILRALVEDIRTAHIDPAAFLSELNQRYHEIIERSGQVIFASACYLLFDTQRGVVHGASAGHPLPLRARMNGNGVEHLLPESRPKFPLGMMEGVQYKEATVGIAPDDLILLYTDGITEAESDAGQQYGERALSEQVASHITMHAQELVHDVAEQVKIHAHGSMQDDVCMVAIRVMLAAA